MKPKDVNCVVARHDQGGAKMGETSTRVSDVNFTRNLNFRNVPTVLHVFSCEVRVNPLNIEDPDLLVPAAASCGGMNGRIICDSCCHWMLKSLFKRLSRLKYASADLSFSGESFSLLLQRPWRSRLLCLNMGPQSA